MSRAGLISSQPDVARLCPESSSMAGCVSGREMLIWGHIVSMNNLFPAAVLETNFFTGGLGAGSRGQVPHPTFFVL